MGYMHNKCPVTFEFLELQLIGIHYIDNLMRSTPLRCQPLGADSTLADYIHHISSQGGPHLMAHSFDHLSYAVVALNLMY